MSGSSSRLTMSEPRPRPAMHRNRGLSDSESAMSRTRGSHTTRCNGGGDRPNNWQEISDWPLAGNQLDNYQLANNAEQDNRQKRERPELNVGWSAVRDESPKPATRTPVTFPRISVMKVQRGNVANIRQRLMLNDDDDDNSSDGEKSNDCNVQLEVEKRPRNNSGSVASSLTVGGAVGGGSSRNTNLNNEREGPDSNQIIGRLMQIRDYIKQTTAMMQQMKEPPNLCSEDSYFKLNSLLESLRKQEKGYLNLLQKVLEAKEEDMLIRQNSSDSRQVLGSDVSTEIEAQSDVSTDTQADLGAVNDELQSLRQQHELLKEMLSQQEQLRALHSRQAALTALKKQAEESRNEQRSRNMDVLDSDIQRQPGIDENRLNLENTSLESEDITMTTATNDQESSDDRASAVGQGSVMMQKFPRLENLCPTEEQQTESLNIIGQQNVESEASQPANSFERRQLQNKLFSLQQKKQEMDQLLEELQTLRDEQLLAQAVNNAVNPKMCQPDMTGRTDPGMDVGTDEDPRNIEQVMEVRRKLKKLEEVKGRLDQLKQLVQYYKTSTEFIHGPQQEEGDGPGAYTRAAYTSEAARDLIDVSSEPPIGEYERTNFITNLRQMNVSSSRKLPKPGGMSTVDLECAVQSSQASGGSMHNGAMSDESSDFGGWGNDPDVKDKVRRLKAAKEKLHHLQALVSVAQNSPEGLQFLPKDLAELAASFGNPELDDESGDLGEVSRSGDITAAATGSNTSADVSSTKQDESEKFYQSRMAEQRFELEQLMEEKRKLLALQENLQRLHDELPRITQNDVSAATTRQAAASVRQQEHAQVQTENDPSVLNTEVKSISETTQVTFGEPLETVISNEELYGRMRQQRILREELREKKKELENFMKKDRPKRHYFRNQDNQSDNISYSNKSDQYGASASEDVTMATWGGSTAGNMESIEENDSREGQGVEDCNDGYPNDGIIQVEEEEEANDQSEDRVTYTVEDDFSNKRMHGLPAVGSPCGHNGNRKGGKGAPFVSTGAAANYSYSQWAANQHTVLNNARRPAFEQSKLGRARRMPPRKDKAVEDEINSLKEQVQYLTSLIQNKPELASSQLFPSQLGPSMTSPGLFSPFPSSYPNQAYDRQLLSAMEEMRERISMLERNSIYLEPWHQRSWPHHPGCIPSGSMPLAGHSVPVVQNYDTPPMSNESIALDQAPSVRPCPPNVGFVDLYAPSVPSSSYAYRNWANTRQREPTSVDRPAGYSEKHDEAGEGIRSCHTVSVESQHTSSYSMAAQEMPTSLVHSADNIPIETVHAVNEQAIRERGRTRMRSSRSDETMAASTFLTNKEKKAYDKQFTCDRAKDDIVIACRFSTPMRLATGAHLAEQQLSEDLLVDPGQRPSNEAVMSAQTVSSVAGSDGDVEQYRAYVHASTKTPDDAESDASNDIRAFEALRETIYAEVATLISQNETRPHFLIKLFRELQHLDSDYLRQRVLYAIQDLVLKRLTEDNIACNQVSGNRHNNLAPAPEDLTPSESLLSTEDGNKDDNGDINSRGAESVNSDRFDYAENVDTSSSLSTPTSTDTHSDQPFAGDSLGDTVIHMEKHPGIDTHQLDVQIKDIMKEIMPVLKEHMDEICSQHLLQYIKRLVMLLMKQHDEEHEMARFFHGQLGTLLQDALAKFEGRRLRDCGEDLLVDMSEILFNELAFFRLMQGLDNPKAKVKASLQQWQQNEPTILIDNTASAREESKELKTSRTNHQHETFCSPGQEEDDIHSSSSSESPAQNGQIEDEDGQQLASMKGSSEGYILPFGLKQDQDSGETSYFSAMKIELAPSETKPYTRIGSDEDDEGDDEAANNEEPSDTAVSRDAQNGIMDDSSSADEQLKNDKLIQDSTNGDSTVLKQEQPKEEKSEEAPTTTNNPESSEQEKEKDDDDTEKEAASGTDGKINNSELTIDDLPTKLTGLSEEELAGKMAAEQEANQITEAMASAVPPGGTPLAGDPEAVNGPA